jgi:hypothetical protein
VITEETPGWYKFKERLKAALSVKGNWDTEVLKYPLEPDVTTVYERFDRQMPLQ